MLFKSAYIGNNEIVKAYKGDTLFYQKSGGGYVTDGLTFHIDGIENYIVNAVVDLCGNASFQTRTISFDSTKTVIGNGNRNDIAYINILQTSMFDTSKAFTVNLVIDRLTTTDFETYCFGITKSNNVGSAGRSNCGWYQDYTKLRWWRGGDTLYTDDVSLSSLQNPTHIDIVSSGTAYSIYINGRFKGSANITKSDSGSWNLCLGNYHRGYANAQSRWGLYSAKVYNRALNADEVAQNYKADKVRFSI